MFALSPAGRSAIRLVLLAAAVLFFELALIRFTSAEVLYLGYFSNFVLISAFVGLGLGFLAREHRWDVGKLVPLLLLVLFAFVRLTRFDVSDLFNRHGLFFFGNITGESRVPGLVLLVVLFVLVVAAFMALGRQVAEVFAELPPLRAYTFDIIGSLLGILLFSLQSYGWSGPVAWVVTGSLLLAIAYLLAEKAAMRRRAIWLGGATLTIVVVLLASASDDEVLWSSYQKLDYHTQPRKGRIAIKANSIPHQFILRAKEAAFFWYSLPYREHLEAGGALDRVLVVGAGSGTDVAVALRLGAGHVDAVEIDPGIIAIGERLHPDRPYADKRVTVVAADGREFLRHSDHQYDLILFALPDSLMRLSSLSNVRLESYLFTLEAFGDVRRRLKPGGSFVLYNQFRWEWLRQRLAAMLQVTFRHPPRRVDDGPQTIFLAGERFAGAAPVDTPGVLATDDWPFLYMQEPGVHWLYLAMIAMFVAAALGGVWFFLPTGKLRRPAWPFFAMGVAFLLLETKSLSFFSLLFGTTWVVNSLAFAGVLLSVLLANAVVERWVIKRRALVFVALFVALLVAYLVPTRALLAIEASWLRYVVAITLVFSPIFLANVIFSRELRDSVSGTRALGWNLLGAVVGGGLEYLALLWGQRNLLWLVALSYLVVAMLLFGRGYLRDKQLPTTR